MILHPFSAQLPRQEVVSTHPEMLKNARERFPELLAQGAYNKAEQTAYYIVEISEDGRHYSYGICGLMNTADFGGKTGKVRPHEGTLKAREEIQWAADLASRYHIKPVLLTCPDNAELQLLLVGHCRSHDSDLTYKLGQLCINIYVVDNPELLDGWKKQLTQISAPVAVADGHHRISTAQRLSREPVHGPDFQRFPALLIPANSLRIESYLRSVADHTIDAERVIEKLRLFFDIAPLQQPFLPVRPGEWMLAHGGNFYRLNAIKDRSENDPVWFSDEVLPKVFGIVDPGNDSRLQLVAANGGTENLMTLASTAPASWHFQYAPVPMEAFFDLLRQDRIFPPKSTRFLPRFPSGLLAYKRNGGV